MICLTEFIWSYLNLTGSLDSFLTESEDIELKINICQCKNTQKKNRNEFILNLYYLVLVHIEENTV